MNLKRQEIEVKDTGDREKLKTQIKKNLKTLEIEKNLKTLEIEKNLKTLEIEKKT